MARTGPRIQYRSNGLILGLQPLGRRVMDAITGFWTHEAYLVTNDYGDRVDCRGEGLDIDEGVPNASVGGRGNAFEP